jgi:hypothetical protein
MTSIICSVATSINTRSMNRSNEIIRIKNIIKNINNNNTELGTKFRQGFKKVFDEEIDYVIDNGGTNAHHYDFTIVLKNGKHMQCEEKGTCKMINLNSLIQPWEKSVQRFNGPGNKFSIGIKYAKHWYNLVIQNGNLAKEYGITNNVPSLEEWLNKDAFKCGNPTSSYGKEFKKKYRQKHPRSSLNGKLNSPKDFRIEVNSTFEFTEEDKKKLIEETQNKLDITMSNKDCWLTTCGDIYGKFDFKWFKNISSVKIEDITIDYEEGGDIYFHFKTNNESQNFKCILRFGKGTGFSNIRFDIR